VPEPRLLGIETEYAVSAVAAHGIRVGQPLLLDTLMQRARQRLPHLGDDHSSGMFLANGGRFYVDAGGHPELTTPECLSPTEVLRYVRAGETILRGLTEDGAPLVPGSRTSIYRSNVDYSGSRATWGCHESVMHRADPRSLPDQLIAHLVSRMVFTGAGGFDNVTAGVKFTLSPRATHVHHAVSGGSTSGRGIFHTKNESLCGGDYHRLHVIFGESLGSDLGCFLKVGTTALIVALCEAGLHPGDDVRLPAPVDAAHLFAGDPTCTMRVSTLSGPRSAVSIQRHYLEQVESQLDKGLLPPWAPEVCRRWRDVLERLEGGWQGVATSLDWAIKFGLFREHVRRRGFVWESLAQWTAIAERFATALAKTPFRERPLRASFLRRLALPIRDEVGRLQLQARRMGLDWDDFPRFLDLRDELFEIDTRFGELGPDGLFTSLDRAGVLTHRLVDGDEVASAVEHPPSVGRALVRGRLVRQLSGHDDRYCCDWARVWDCETGRCVDLTDPFATSMAWTDVHPTTRGEARPDHLEALEQHLLFARSRVRRVQAGRRRQESPDDTTNPIELSDRARRCRMRGQLDEAERIFRRAMEIEDARVAPDSPKRPHRRNHLAMVLLRAGRLDEAKTWNAEAWCLKAGRHDLVSGRILFIRIALCLLQGRRDVALYLGQLKTVFNLDPLECLADIAVTWEIHDVLDTLCEHLPDADATLLVHLTEALNDREHLEVLETFEEWRTVEAVGLEVAWPE
jgi:tetratricopeptide (TPR) repeat protein